MAYSTTTAKVTARPTLLTPWSKGTPLVPSYSLPVEWMACPGPTELARKAATSAKVARHEPDAGRDACTRRGLPCHAAAGHYRREGSGGRQPATAAVHGTNRSTTRCELSSTTSKLCRKGTLREGDVEEARTQRDQGASLVEEHDERASALLPIHVPALPPPPASACP